MSANKKNTNNGTTSTDYRLYRSQTAVLTEIVKLTTRNYRFHLIANAPANKILGAVTKIDEKHHVLVSADHQCVRGRSGLPRARLILAPRPEGGVWPYALIGDTKLKGEAVRRFDNVPTRWPAYRRHLGRWVDTYELVVAPSTGRLTWRLVDQVFEELLQAVVTAAREGRWDEVVKTLKLATLYPMFGGVRVQVQRVYDAAHKFWGDRQYRNSGGKWGSPPWNQFEIPKPLGLGNELRVRDDEWPARPVTLGDWVNTGRDIPDTN